MFTYVEFPHCPPQIATGNSRLFECYMYLIAVNKVVAVVDVIKISPVQTFYDTFLRLTPFSFHGREQSKSFTCSGVFVCR